MKEKSKNIYWREVKKLRRIEGAKPVEIKNNSYLFDGKTVFWHTHDSGEAMHWLAHEADKNKPIVK